MKYSQYKTPIVIAICSLVLFVPFLGFAHLFDWDEINFAECAREMVLTNQYSSVQIDFLPFWEKPPLFIWLQAIAMKIFGVSAFAARLPNAICGVVTLLTVYFIGKKIYDEKFARLWVLAFAGSLLPQFYFHTGLIDPWFNLFIFLGIYHFAIYTNNYSSLSSQHFFNRSIVLAAFFIALAVLTKGPVAVLLFGICFCIWRLWKRKAIMSWKHFFLFIGIALILPSVWFLTLVAQGKGYLVQEFIAYQIRLFSTEDAGHGGSFFYHWIILFVGCFPASIFAMLSLFKKVDDTPFEVHLLKFMRILFWVVLILFSIVKTKIIHYSSLCYFPITYLAAYTCYKLINGSFVWKRWMTLFVLAIGGIFSAVFTLLPFLPYFKKELINAGFFKDTFAVANLQANANWSGFEWMVGLIFIVGIFTAIYFLLNNNFSRSIPILFGTVLITTTLATVLLAPRVEEYSQGAAIEFWKDHSGASFYCETIGYKSYAQYFYGNTQPTISKNSNYIDFKKTNGQRLANLLLSNSENEINIQREWMLTGVTDKSSFFICKNWFEAEVSKSYPNLEKIGSKNGFIFWKRGK